LQGKGRGSGAGARLLRRLTASGKEEKKKEKKRGEKNRKKKDLVRKATAHCERRPSKQADEWYGRGERRRTSSREWGGKSKRNYQIGVRGGKVEGTLKHREEKGRRGGNVRRSEVYRLGRGGE